MVDAVFFKGRDINPWGVYVEAGDLVEGRTYFAVHYLDKDLMIPELKPFVFIGRNLVHNDQATLYFQDAASYAAGSRWENDVNADGGEVHTVTEGTPFVYEFEQALDRLLYCSLLRWKAGI